MKPKKMKETSQTLKNQVSEEWTGFKMKLISRPRAKKMKMSLI